MSSDVYSVASYGDMIETEPRMTAFTEALRSAITPGCTVLDLGAGFGVFAILACKFGAGRVIAVEPAEAITLGPEIARANGCADRIEFIQATSQELGEEYRADVIIADLRGAMPLFSHHISTIIDARNRLLAPGGVLISQRDQMHCALISDEAIAKRVFRPWQSNNYDLDLSAGSRLAVNVPSRRRFEPESVISNSANLLSLDYQTITELDASSTAILTATRPAVAHGCVVWFDAELAGGHGFSNSPDQPELIYSQTFFPFERPVAMAEGDSAEVTFDFQHIGDGYTKSWKTRFDRAGHPDLSFSQAEALSEFVTAAQLRRRSGSYVPQSTSRLDLDRYCLSRFDGQTALQTIAQGALERAPDRFSSETDALAYVTALSQRYYEPRQ